MKKLFTLSGILLACTLLFSGCNMAGSSSKEKTFSKAGMEITLTEAFSEEELVSQTACYLSRDVVVTVLKEDFSILADANVSSDISLAEYAEVVCTANGLEAPITEEDGQTYFTYEKETTGKKYTYFATVHRSDDAYWLIQFACETDDFAEEKPTFIKWANSISFS